tara:strand:- start:1935 stop:2507 length:573 start_codon:yes stop_codon:yes gene_type:complete
MPHNPDDIGVNINDYLGALGRYNLQYGGNQGNQVISSATAPGYSYQNPQTQEIYPLYPEGTEPQGPPQGGGFSGGEGRFHDYLNSIGAQQAELGWNRGQVGYAGDQVEGNDQNFVRIEGGKHFFPMGNPVGIGPEYEFGEHADTRNTYRNEGQPAYLDKKGGFLGYGGTPDEVFQSSPLLQRQYYESLNR